MNFKILQSKSCCRIEGDWNFNQKALYTFRKRFSNSQYRYQTTSVKLVDCSLDEWRILKR